MRVTPVSIGFAVTFRRITRRITVCDAEMIGPTKRPKTACLSARRDFSGSRDWRLELWLSSRTTTTCKSGTYDHVQDYQRAEDEERYCRAVSLGPSRRELGLPDTAATRTPHPGRRVRQAVMAVRLKTSATPQEGLARRMASALVSRNDLATDAFTVWTGSRYGSPAPMTEPGIGKEMSAASTTFHVWFSLFHRKNRSTTSPSPLTASTALRTHFIGSSHGHCPVLI